MNAAAEGAQFEVHSTSTLPDTLGGDLSSGDNLLSYAVRELGAQEQVILLAVACGEDSIRKHHW